MNRISFVFVAVLMCLVSVSLTHAQGGFITFDAPGAGSGPGQGTLPQQITAAGTIVGNYVDSNYVTHGFVRSAQGTFASIDAPGALRTQALGMTQCIPQLIRSTVAVDMLRSRKGCVLPHIASDTQDIRHSDECEFP